MKIGKLIKVLALQEDMTMTEMAEKLGISRQGLYKRLNGTMRVDSLQECLKILGYDLYYGKD